MQFAPAMRDRDEYAKFWVNNRLMSCILAIKYALAGILRPITVVLLGVFSRCREEMIAIEKQVACYGRLDVDKKWKQKVFGAVKDANEIAKTRHSLDCNAVTVITS